MAVVARTRFVSCMAECPVVTLRQFVSATSRPFPRRSSVSLSGVSSLCAGPEVDAPGAAGPGAESARGAAPSRQAVRRQRALYVPTDARAAVT